MTDPQRARRLAAQIQEIVAESIRAQEVKDPRLEMVTVTDTRVTGDLHDATVYYTVYGGDTEVQESAEGLEDVRRPLRAEVGRQLGIKFTPTLTFVRDEIPESARAFEQLLESARASDEALRKARLGAVPAGDPDPYRFSEPEPDADALPNRGSDEQ